ncbi:MAG: hypothetical protein KC468_01330 [Myxococcales bacterium]|nr:hypothetical protein [Myxococcales bacterium]
MRARGRWLITLMAAAVAVACGGPDAPEGSRGSDGELTGASASSTGATGAGTDASDASAGATTTGSTNGAPTESTTGSTTGDDGSGTGDDWATGGSTGGHEEGECDYALVHAQPGAALWVSDEQPVLELSPLAPGEGFYCMRVEFDMQTLDNLEALVDAHGGCPELLSIASIFGTTATGDVLATAFFHHRAWEGETCAAVEPQAEAGNYLEYTAGVAGPWPPGQVWHVTLEAKPWLTRLELSQGDARVGPSIEAGLYPANVEDTRDPVVRLGQPMIVSEKFFPWFGATYANVEVWADVAPP